MSRIWTNFNDAGGTNLFSMGCDWNETVSAKWVTCTPKLIRWDQYNYGSDNANYDVKLCCNSHETGLSLTTWGTYSLPNGSGTRDMPAGQWSEYRFPRGVYDYQVWFDFDPKNDFNPASGAADVYWYKNSQGAWENCAADDRADREDNRKKMRHCCALTIPAVESGTAPVLVYGRATKAAADSQRYSNGQCFIYTGTDPSDSNYSPAVCTYPQGDGSYGDGGSTSCLFYMNGNSAIATPKGGSIAAARLPSTAPSMSGHKFLGWTFSYYFNLLPYCGVASQYEANAYGDSTYNMLDLWADKTEATRVWNYMIHLHEATGIDVNKVYQPGALVPLIAPYIYPVWGTTANPTGSHTLTVSHNLYDRYTATMYVGSSDVTSPSSASYNLPKYWRIPYMLDFTPSITGYNFDGYYFAASYSAKPTSGQLRIDNGDWFKVEYSDEGYWSPLKDAPSLFLRYNIEAWPKSYSITFNANGGKFPNGTTSRNYTRYYKQTVLKGTEATPTRNGYEFLGWYWTGTTTKLTSSTLLDAAHIGSSVEAHWQSDQDAFIKVNGEWVGAEIYIKDRGQWKMTDPYFKQNGTWKLVRNSG